MEKRRCDQNLFYVYLLVIPFVEVACAFIMLCHPANFVSLLFLLQSSGSNITESKEANERSIQQVWFWKNEKEGWKCGRNSRKLWVFFIKQIISVFLQTSRKNVQVTLFGQVGKIHQQLPFECILFLSVSIGLSSMSNPMWTILLWIFSIFDFQMWCLRQ